MTKSSMPSIGRFGLELKAARKNRKLTLESLASDAGISVSMLSKIENNKAVPSLTTLHRIVEALGLNIGMLFSGATDEKSIIFRNNQRPRISAKNGVFLERLVPFGDHHIMQGNIHIVEPGCGSEGSMQHEGEEVGFILEGILDLVVDGNMYRLKTGDSFNFNSRLMHSYRNPGQIVCKVIWINTPPTF